MDNNIPTHKSVMMNEVLEILNPKSNETYIDCTLGAGGHTRKILDSANCHVIGIDRDPMVFSFPLPLAITLAITHPQQKFLNPVSNDLRMP